MNSYSVEIKQNLVLPIEEFLFISTLISFDSPVINVTTVNRIQQSPLKMSLLQSVIKLKENEL